MLDKRFYLRLQLQLHAITCPGVWLCSHGYLEVTLKTLGYYFRTGAMEPRFPLLCHDTFVMEGYFKNVSSLAEMQRMVRAEQLEITLWQNGRRLAYYMGTLSMLMQPGVPRLSCAHSDLVQLLMKATPAFPGILAPKVELSAQLSTQDKQCDSCCGKAERSLGRQVKICSPSREEQPRKQQAVCHSKQSSCYMSNYSSCDSLESLLNAPQQRRLSSCSASTQLSNDSRTLSQDSSCASNNGCSHCCNCYICNAYGRMFNCA
ncbi:CG14079 [Drosophila busckii]|uniref:CG14079 n=1 Tax=Drosophila busckii TaxID=30019 RepID=A0A0M5IZA6_DROBS|nr:uncharacterized protein LOC108598972 [Drosophila busckii]ALC45144.1 CG14079 [Drosophila busckii]